MFVPACMLITLRNPGNSAAGLVLGGGIVLFFLLIGRWDIVGYGLQFVFLLTLIMVAWLREGWLWAAISLATWLLLKLLLGRRGNETPLELSFPLGNGTYYVAHGGNFRLLNHHRVSKSQAFALDIVRLNKLGMRAAGIYPRRLEKYAIFGDVLHSPCDGVVTAAIDDLPDMPPGEMDKKFVAGNHIVIQVEGSEVYVGLAHLMRGSFMVHAGEHVKAGQPLARAGNSGNTSEPHLHIHAKRGGNPKLMLDGAGVPLRFGGRWLIRNSLVRSRSPKD